MSEVVLIEQLDQAIAAMFRNENALTADSDSQVGELLGIAAELRMLPRADFKARLKVELNEVSMSLATKEQMETDDRSPANDSARATFGTVTPYLTVPSVHEEIDFVTKVFGAEGKIYGLGSAGGYHSEYQIGDSMVMIGGGGEGSSWKGTPHPASLHVYVKDVDAVYERAVQAGATSLMVPTNQEYGDRDAAVIDSGGNHWYIGTSQGAAYKPEGVSDLMPYLHPTGAPRLIDFLKQAFAAEEVFVYQSPEGTVRHAKIAIGNSIVEMGEAHGQWQPMPMVFMLYVDDVDAWYARAMRTAGAISLAAPKDQAYGDRTGAVKDPFDNVWYIGTRSGAQETRDDRIREDSMAAPKLFRIALQVGDLDQASAFYSRLLDDPGRRIPRGSRHYFDCGPVILALIDVTAGQLEPQPIPDYVYLAVSDLDQIYERAKAMNCLAKEDVHGADAGAIVKRPWGERSFYVDDPWGNGLCFVDEETLFTGR